MNAVQKQLEIIGIDRGGSRDCTVFTFICTDCEREEYSTVARLPQGWDIVPLDCSGVQAIRCPDCNEAIEQARFAQMHTRLVDFHEKQDRLDELAELEEARIGDECPCFTCTVDANGKTRLPDGAPIGIHPPKPRKAASARPFSIHLERNASQYLVALTPETALMRCTPLGFFLSAEGARTFAWELLRFADLAEAPGTLPASMGERK